MSNRTNEILSKIMETAGVDQENFSESDAGILRLLRYYRQDIPAAPAIYTMAMRSASTMMMRLSMQFRMKRVSNGWLNAGM